MGCGGSRLNDSQLELRNGVWVPTRAPPKQPPKNVTPGLCKCTKHKRRLRVLSIDGGGVRGIIPLMFLDRLNRDTGKNITDLFDLIAGTSVGGIITMAMNVPKPDTPPGQLPEPKHSISELMKWFLDNAHVIFPSPSLAKDLVTADGLLGVKYSPEALEELLRKFFGQTYLSESIRDVLITTYEITEGANLFFKSRSAWADSTVDFPMWQVCRATSAAPTFYPPAQIRLRPGITRKDVLSRPKSHTEARTQGTKTAEAAIQNNMQALTGAPATAAESGAAALAAPAAQAASAAPAAPAPSADAKSSTAEQPVRKLTKEEISTEDITCVDGGLIANNPAMCACAEALAYYDFVDKPDDVFMLSLGTGYQNDAFDPVASQSWGALQWIRPLLTIMMDGTATATHFQMRQMLHEDRYFRFDVNITPRKEDLEWLKSKGAEDKASILGHMDKADPINLEYMQRRMNEYLDKQASKESYQKLLALLKDEMSSQETILQEIVHHLEQLVDPDVSGPQKNITADERDQSATADE